MPRAPSCNLATPVGGADRCKTRRCTRAGYLPSQLARSIVGVAMATAMTINAHRRPTVKRHPPPQRRLPQSRPTSVEVGDFLLCPPELELEDLGVESFPPFVCLACRGIGSQSSEFRVYISQYWVASAPGASRLPCLTCLSFHGPQFPALPAPSFAFFVARSSGSRRNACGVSAARSGDTVFPATQPARENVLVERDRRSAGWQFGAAGPPMARLSPALRLCPSAAENMLCSSCACHQEEEGVVVHSH